MICYRGGVEELDAVASVGARGLEKIEGSGGGGTGAGGGDVGTEGVGA